jgi:hypothetical protein
MLIIGTDPEDIKYFGTDAKDKKILDLNPDLVF